MWWSEVVQTLVEVNLESNVREYHVTFYYKEKTQAEKEPCRFE